MFIWENYIKNITVSRRPSFCLEVLFKKTLRSSLVILFFLIFMKKKVTLARLSLSLVGLFRITPHHHLRASLFGRCIFAKVISTMLRHLSRVGLALILPERKSITIC